MSTPWANGCIPLSALTLTSTGHRLTAAAAASFDRMAVAFRRDLGYSLAITDGYRDLADQILVKALKGILAAVPGTSVHGLGLALDLGSGVNVEGSAAHRWMDAHASEYGWVNPPWAQNYDPRDGQHEPWHWEYVAQLDQHAGGSLAARPMTPETLQGEDHLMFIATRIGDEAAYLVGPTSMIQLTFDQAQAYLAAGVPVRRLGPAQVLAIMQAVHYSAADEGATQVAYGVHS